MWFWFAFPYVLWNPAFLSNILFNVLRVWHFQYISEHLFAAQWWWWMCIVISYKDTLSPILHDCHSFPKFHKKQQQKVYFLSRAMLSQVHRSIMNQLVFHTLSFYSPIIYCFGYSRLALLLWTYELTLLCLSSLNVFYSSVICGGFHPSFFVTKHWKQSDCRFWVQDVFCFEDTHHRPTVCLSVHLLSVALLFPFNL